MGQISQVMDLWHERMEHYGHPHEHIDLAVGMDVYVAPTMEEAESDLIGLEDEINEVFRRVGNPRSADGTIPEGFKHWANREEDRLLGAKRALKEGMLPLVGTPEVVCERIENLRSKGIRSIRGTFGKAGLEQEKAPAMHPDVRGRGDAQLRRRTGGCNPGLTHSHTPRKV